MRRALLETFLACPLDKAFPLAASAEAQWTGDDLVEGTLTCPRCNTGFPVREGVPSFLPPKGTQDEAVQEAKVRESKARDEDSAVYDDTMVDYHSKLELRALTRGLKANAGNVVLDVGAGTGRMTVALGKTGATVLAMDISTRSLLRNREKCQAAGLLNVHHLATDACFLPLREGIADKAGSAMMLEHLPTQEDRARCLREVRRALKPSGRFALTVYNYSLRKRRKYPREGFHGKNLYFYNLDAPEMRRMLDGYRVRRLTALHSLPGRLHLSVLDRLITRVPPLANLLGQLLFVVAERRD